MRPRVLIETPFLDGGTDAIRYLAWCLLDSILRGEAPFASHAIYPLALPENVLMLANLSGREIGLQCRDSWAAAAQKVVQYVDLGISDGMRRPAHCEPIQRRLPDDLLAAHNAGKWPSQARWATSNH